MVMWYKKGASHSWAYKQRELNSKVLAVAKHEKIGKIGPVFFLPFIPRSSFTHTHLGMSSLS